MQFESAVFFFFLTGTLLLYYCVPQRARVFVLACANLLFYAAAGFQHCILLLGTCVWAYAAGLWLRRPCRRKAVLMLAVGGMAAGLVLWKCAAALRGADRPLALPLGISFYSFLLMAYVVDQYRCKYPPQSNFLHFFAFAAFFPLISAGPIERGDGLGAQIAQPQAFVYERFAAGTSRMLWGFFKKFVIADTLAGMVGAVFHEVQAYSGPYLLLASLLYSYQLYCDFSGYSDIAIGAAQLLGFTVKENFARPFAAHGFQELWARWHISLTSWFRDYLYIPLGGSRSGVMRTGLNILLVFLISGLWHGLGPTFAVWGLLNGIYMVLARVWHSMQRSKHKVHRPCGRGARMMQLVGLYLMFTSCIVFFRAQSIQDALAIYAGLPTGWVQAAGSPAEVIATLKSMGIGRVTGFVMLASILLCELIEWRAARAGQTTGAWMRTLSAGRRMLLYYVLALLVLMFGKMGSSSFIYFAF